MTRNAAYGLNFAGGAATDNLSYPRTSTLGNWPQKTVAGWFYARSNGGGNAARICLRTNGSKWDYVFIGTAIQFRQFTDTVSGMWSFLYPSLNAWHHIAFTYDNSSLSNVPTFWVDGVAQSFSSSTTPTGTVTNDSGATMIFGNSAVAAGNRAWDGYMSNIYVYSRTLSGAEILSLYRMVDPSSSGLVIKDRMALGSGTYTKDESTNSFKGAIVGATYAAIQLPVQRITAVRSVAAVRSIAASRSAA